MPRAREHADGLPYRVYESYGKLIYSIGYKAANGKWLYRYRCAVSDKREIAKLRAKAILDSTKVGRDAPISGWSSLVAAWLQWQADLPDTDPRKRAASTLAENKREADNLIKAWGSFDLHEIDKPLAYEYLEAAVAAGRPEKANKEMALARVILEFAVRKGLLQANPLDGLEKNRTVKAGRLVTPEEIALVLDAGRQMGGAYHLMALAMKTAYLCLRRSVEVRALTKDGISEAGLVWRDGKVRKGKPKPDVLIEWSPELKATIEEAQGIERYEGAGDFYVFGNLRGQRYTKGGWKANLVRLMGKAEGLAKQRKVPFTKFSLQECRPAGVTDKLEQGHEDVQDATLHTNLRMIEATYDRRRQRRATPAR